MTVPCTRDATARIGSPGGGVVVAARSAHAASSDLDTDILPILRGGIDSSVRERQM